MLPPTWLLLSAVLLACSQLLFLSTASQPSQIAGLSRLYHDFNGEGWIWPNTTTAGQEWVFDGNSDPCGDKWYGVNCSSSFIISLTLGGYNLSGTFSDDVFRNLTSLLVLNFAKNDIRGSLPTSLYSLRRLQTLNMTRNSISGHISADVRYLTSLQELSLSENLLSGEIPSSITSLGYLRSLQLMDNSFFGSIPSRIGKEKFL